MYFAVDIDDNGLEIASACFANTPLMALATVVHEETKDMRTEPTVTITIKDNGEHVAEIEYSIPMFNQPFYKTISVFIEK